MTLLPYLAVLVYFLAAPGIAVGLGSSYRGAGFRIALVAHLGGFYWLTRGARRRRATDPEA
mgnify:CR=1 FL=1